MASKTALVVIVSLFFGCKSEPPPIVSVPPPVAPPASVAPEVHAVPRVVRGRVVGRDGAPLPMAHVRRREADGTFGEGVTVASDGSFRVDVPEGELGLVALEVTGAGHQRAVLRVSGADGTVDVDVRLGTYTPKRSAEPIVVVFRAGKSYKRQVMKPDGATFVADIALDDGTYGYELAGLITEGRVFGFESRGEGWQYDGDGDYATVFTARGGTAHFTYDPATLAPATDTRLEVGRPGSTSARLSAIGHERDAAARGLEQELRERGKTGKALSDLVAAMAPRRASFLAATRDERPLVRQLATLSYFSIGASGAASDADRTLARRIATELGPTDAMWNEAGAEGLLFVAADEDVNRAIIEHHPSAKVVAMLLRARMFKTQDVDERRRIAQQLKAPRFQDNRDAQLALNADPDRVLAPGKSMPSFEVPALVGDTTKGTLSSKNVAGKIYLINVWSTECAACVAELPVLNALHARYAKRSGKRLEILSVSVDDKAATVAKFLADKAHPMPWLHGVAGPDPKGSRFFDAMGWSGGSPGLPFKVLVDETGKILGSSPDVDVPTTLARLLPANP